MPPPTTMNFKVTVARWPDMILNGKSVGEETSKIPGRKCQETFPYVGNVSVRLIFPSEYRHPYNCPAKHGIVDR